LKPTLSYGDIRGGAEDAPRFDFLVQAPLLGLPLLNRFMLCACGVSRLTKYPRQWTRCRD